MAERKHMPKIDRDKLFDADVLLTQKKIEVERRARQRPRISGSFLPWSPE